MRRWIACVLLVVPLCLIVDFGASILHAYLFRREVGSLEILPALCDRVRPGMSRSEVERQLDGYRELRLEPDSEGYSMAYGYWFGFIPPLGKSEIKLVGEIYVSFSGTNRAIECSFWYN